MTLLALANTGESRLILAGISRWGYWLAAGIAALLLILMLYRYERKLVSKRAGLTLLTLRVLAALALITALFEPIASRTYRETVRGRVVVGVDLSESMATTDGDVSAHPRRDVARDLISGDWIKTITSAHDVEALGFARDSTGDGPLLGLIERLKTPGKPDDPAFLATDWTSVLEHGLKDSERPTVGIVLLTDGRSNAGDESTALADKLAARGVPIYPVLIGSMAKPNDAAIATIKAPERVSKGDVADILVTVKIDGPIVGSEVPVTLDRPGTSPIKKMVRVPADGSRPVVAFRVPMDSIGLQTMTAAVGPIDGDTRVDNDRRTVSVEVADDRSKVLLVDGEARWEFQYLRNALVRDPQVTVDSVVFHQPTMKGGEPAYKTALPPRLDASSKTPDPLGAYDLIIIGDVKSEDMNAEAWSRLAWYADTRGGTLVLAAGPRSLASWSNQETARKLLPVLDPRPATIDPMKIDPTRPALPAGAAIIPAASVLVEGFPMIRLDADNTKNLELWKALPKQPWAASGKPKPLASVLATIESVDSESNATIVAQPYGLGKVLWIGLDGTWRWRYRVGDRYHHRFWGQVIRWASGAKLAVGNRAVRFGPTRPRLPEGESATIRAQFADDASGVNSDLLVAAKIFKKGKDGKPEGDAVIVVPLKPRADQPRVFEAAAPPIVNGSYLIRLDVPQMGTDAPTDSLATLEILAKETPERVDLAADRDALDRLAATTGGRVFTVLDVGSLPTLLKSKTIERNRTEETSLWDQPWSLMLFFGILAAEWILRKRAGLP